MFSNITKYLQRPYPETGAVEGVGFLYKAPSNQSLPLAQGAFHHHQPAVPYIYIYINTTYQFNTFLRLNVKYKQKLNSKGHVPQSGAGAPAGATGANTLCGANNTHGATTCGTLPIHWTNLTCPSSPWEACHQYWQSMTEEASLTNRLHTAYRTRSA